MRMPQRLLERPSHSARDLQKESREIMIYKSERVDGFGIVFGGFKVLREPWGSLHNKPVIFRLCRTSSQASSHLI